MKIYLMAALMVLVLAGSGAFALSSIQETASQAYTTVGSRLDYQEDVNLYGREPATAGNEAQWVLGNRRMDEGCGAGGHLTRR